MHLAAAPTAEREALQQRVPLPRCAALVGEPRPRVVAGGGRAIRWDRVGRVALLMVLLGVVALYVGPSISFLSTYREATARRSETSPRAAR